MKILRNLFSLVLIICIVFACFVNVSATKSNWQTMYDFEGLTSVPSYTNKGSAKSFGIATISKLTVPNYTIADSQNCCSIYVDSGILNPVGSTGTPITVTLDSQKMNNATGIRVLFGMASNSYNCKGLYYGFYYENEYYYTSIDYKLYNTTFSWLYFVGKTFTSATDQTTTLTITKENVSNIQKVSFWLYAGGALTGYIDDIQYTTDQTDEAGTEEYAQLNISVKKETPLKITREHTNDKSKENIALFLVIGQSNATMTVGYNREIGPVSKGTLDDYSASVPMPDEGTVYSSQYRAPITSLDNTNDAVNMISKDGVANKLCGFTPGFAKEWYEKTGEKVVLVQCAVGATCMHLWAADPENYTCKCKRTTYYLADSIKYFKTSYEALGKDYNIIHSGYIWNQGEDDLKYDVSGSTICNAQGYYDAYMGMHQALMNTGYIDFGEILPVRNNGGNACTVNATSADARATSYARSAQYRICNESNNIFMGSRALEQAPADGMLASEYYIHCKQITYNTCGKESADYLLSDLQIGNVQQDFDGLELYDTKGILRCKFDKDASIVDGNEYYGKNISSYTSQLLFALFPATGGYNLSYTIDGSDEYIDDFGYIDWTKLETASKSILIFNLSIDGDNIMYGDVNGDKQINLLDLLTIRKYLSDNNIPVNKGADINNDNEVDSKDVLALRRHLCSYKINF